MGLIKAATSSTSSVLGDQFKEFVTCPEMNNTILVQRGQVNHGKGNRKPSESVITNGSIIVVPESTAMMVVENGKILEFSAEAGTYTFDKGAEPSVFYGGFGKGLLDSIKRIGSRTSFGGQATTDDRVYYVNLLTLTGNKFGSPQPKKITDDKYGMLEVTFFGEYAIKVDDPAVLIANVVGSNAKDTILFSDILEDQFKSKFVEKLTQAITIVMRKHKIPFGDIGMYGTDISNEMNNLLDSDLVSKYGIKISDIAIADINLTDESMKRVSKIDDATIFSDSRLQSGLMANASAEALGNASANPNGAMMGFMGMNMANSNGATMINAVRQDGGNSAPIKEEREMPEPGSLFKKEEKPSEKETSQVPSTEKETTSAKAEPSNQVQPHFCPNCGKPINGGNFCTNCGQKLN